MIIIGAIVDRSQCNGNSVNVSWKEEGEGGCLAMGLSVYSVRDPWKQTHRTKIDEKVTNFEFQRCYG